MENIKLVKTTDTENRYDIIRIEAGTIEEVQIPCVLALPQGNRGKSKLTLCFNNEAGEDLEISTANIESELPKMLEGLDYTGPVIIPILPSKKEMDRTLESQGSDFEVGDPKQFARECFKDEIQEGNRFYKLHEQVNSLIQNIISNEHIKAIIQSQRGETSSLEFENKVIGFGHSGAGAAMIRYSVIHPEMFDTVIIGGNGDIIPTPFGENGKELDYPFGVRDYKELFGREFNEEEFKKINFQFYIGELEETKEIYDTIRDNNYGMGTTGKNFAPEKLARRYKNIYGTEFFERFKNVLKQYEENGVNIGLNIYKNDCHSVIKAEDLHAIINGTKTFGSDCSKQLEELIKAKALSYSNGDKGEKDFFSKLSEAVYPPEEVKYDEKKKEDTLMQKDISI